MFDKLKYPLITLTSFLVMSVYGLVIFNLSFLGPVKRALKSLKMTDIYYQISQSVGEPEESQLVTLVDMTELISRRDLAQTLEDIESCDPKAVGVDMIFQGLKEDTVGDEWIRNVANGYDNIIFSYKLIDFDPKEQKYTQTVKPFFAADVEERLGFTNMPRSDLYDDIKRVVPVGRTLNDSVVPSFVSQVVNRFADQEAIKIKPKDITINFRPTKFVVLQPEDVVAHPELITDRIVLFGAMNEEGDMHYTPLGKIAGVELLAYAVQTVLKQQEVKSPPEWLTWVLSFLIALCTLIWTKSYGDYQNRHRKSAFMRVFMTSSLVRGFLMFLWMGIFLGIGFVLFSFFSISMNFGWAFSGMAFLGTGESFFNIIAEKFRKQPDSET